MKKKELQTIISSDAKKSIKKMIEEKAQGKIVGGNGIGAGGWNN